MTIHTYTGNHNTLQRYIKKRLLTLIPVLLGVTFLTYGLMYLSPADPVEMLLQAQGIPVSPEVVEVMKQEAGLDKPFLIQYTVWLGRLFTGDMGVSLIDGKSISNIITAALPRTLLLSLTSVIATITIAIPLGIFTAVKQNTLIDYAIRFFSFLANSVPNFIVSLRLIGLISLRLGWLPVIS